MDLIADFAYPLPLTVISDLLGIPGADRQQFRAWTQAMVDLTTEQEQRTNVIQQFLHYLKAVLDEKRAHPDNDLTSGLVQAEENGD